MSQPTQHQPPPFGPARLAKLTLWFGKHNNRDPSGRGDESKVLEPLRNATKPYHLQILNILQDLLDHSTSPSRTAASLTSCILTSSDPDKAWAWMSGMICTASQYHPLPQQERLADLLIHLTRLPHHLPTPSIPSATDANGSTAFADLPDFGFTLGERLQRTAAAHLQPRLRVP